MKLKYEQAKDLRKNLTPPEFMLWDCIKVRQPGGPIFRRQYAFGHYILDFYCIKAKLAVEVDGSDHQRPEVVQRDEIRDAFLHSHGVFVYRIPASEIFRNLEEIADGVWRLAAARLDRK